MQLETSMSARRDARIYILLLLGMVFLLAGLTIEPSTNCSEGGECAPWLIPVALVVGALALLGAISALVVNAEWGYRFNLDEKRLYWWDTRVSPDLRSLALNEVSLIKVRVVYDSSDKIFFYDQAGNLMPFPYDFEAPVPYEKWTRDIVHLFPGIRVEVEDA